MVQCQKQKDGGSGSKSQTFGWINHPSSYDQLDMGHEVTMPNTGESVSKDRISQLAKEVVSGAKCNPFQETPVFVMQVVNGDLIRVQQPTLNGDTSNNKKLIGTKRSASPSNELVENDNQGKKQRCNLQTL